MDTHDNDKERLHASANRNQHEARHDRVTPCSSLAPVTRLDAFIPSGHASRKSSRFTSALQRLLDGKHRTLHRVRTNDHNTARIALSPISTFSQILDILHHWQMYSYCRDITACQHRIVLPILSISPSLESSRSLFQ